VSTPNLVRLNFTKLFILDVDWSTKEVGAVLCQKDLRKGVVVAYASKGISKSPKNYHPMEGECYALIWVVMHCRQYLHHIDFILRMDHKPLEWLVIVSDAHCRRGCLVNMLQHFSLSRSSTWQEANTHTDTSSRNLVGMPEEDEDLQVEIPDMKVMTFFLCSRKGRRMEWHEMP
jgi:hypothetical protein